MTSCLDHETLEVMRRLSLDARSSDSDNSSVYAPLVRSVYEGTLRKAFPIAAGHLRRLPKSDSDQTAWSELVTRCEKAGAHTPYLWRMPGEVVGSAAAASIADEYSLPWLDDLLRFEWAEVAMTMAPDAPIDRQTPGFVLVPTHTVLHLRHPVHEVDRPERWTEQSDWFVACFRTLEAKQIRYLATTPLVAAIMEVWRARPMSEVDLLGVVMEIVPDAIPDAVSHDISLVTSHFLSEGLIVQNP